MELSKQAALEQAVAPVQARPDMPEVPPTTGEALCLSGGGYRAMLFHAGALRRLNEVGYLKKLDCISAVSGGSIAAGMLGFRWKDLEFVDNVAQNLHDLVIKPLYDLAGKCVDIPAFLAGIGTRSTGTALAAYFRHGPLGFGHAKLAELPDQSEGPLFVFNATSLQSGDTRKFSRLWVWDPTVGMIPDPDVDIAFAVAASASFPPFLSPHVLHFEAGSNVPGPGSDPNLNKPPYTTRLSMTDGGVFDNLGLDPAWFEHRTILISDAGGRLKPKKRPRAFWPLQILRVWAVTDDQVRNLRNGQAIGAFKAEIRDGAYWGIRSDIRNFQPPDTLEAPCDDILPLAKIRTRLWWIRPSKRNRLMNWGYAITDAAMRKHVLDPPPPRPDGFPYPGGVG